MPRPSHRIEHDLLGELSLPADAYYGVQTARALENFRISGVELRLYPDIIRGLAMVKLAAARANFDCGVFSREILDGIEASCAELMDGKLHDQFRLDVFQGGAGTSTNMNANEVIANRALELMGHKKGEYKFCDPHDHLNASQSTNDAYPTALHVALALGNIRLVEAVNALIAAFRAKGREFGGIVKMGRTQLQDAVPMTLGQEFAAFGETLAGEVQGAAGAPERPLRDQHGRDRDRHRAQCAERLRGEVHRAPRRDHRLSDPPRHRPDRGDAGHAGVRPLLVGHEEPGDQAVEGLQRPAAALVGAALRPARDQPAGEAAGLVDHAGQGQPGHSGSRQHGLLPRHRQRHDGDDGGRRRPAPAQRVRAGHRRVPLRGADDVHQRREHAADALRRRHHRQRRRPAATTSSSASAPSPRSTR